MPNKKKIENDDLVENLKESFENINVDEELEKMQATAKQVADVATEFIRKYPLQTVVGAAAAGFLIGVLVKRD